jgi:ADP-dependent NAD(P)H-hydrate dehydratase / NAD(P)H-hydrate epimerase
MRVVSVSEMRDIEERAERDYGLTIRILMDHAGHSVATSLAGKYLSTGLSTAKILILVGPGNNGGDGRVAGQYLSGWGADVTYYLWKEQRLETGTAVSSPVSEDLAPLRQALAESRVVVDALLGTGNSRPLSESMRRLLIVVAEEKRSRPDLFLLALDLPTGLNADTGEVDEATLAADLTVTLALPKRGLFLFPGADFVGRLEVGGIGLPSDLSIPPGLELIEPRAVREMLPRRPLDSNKGTFGKVMVIAGSLRYPGSAYLTASAAGRVGAGLVTLAVTAEMASVYAEKLSEATLLPLPADNAPAGERAAALLDGMEGYRAAVIGPGLGESEQVRSFLEALFAGVRALPPSLRPLLLVDADGLNNLATIPRWWELLPGETVITPHPGEMARLRGGARVSGGGPDRPGTVLAVAREWNLITVLKGANSLVGSPGGAISINAPGNPALATAGTGDVLSGTIGGLLAQGLAPFAAACAGVYLHARAGRQVSERLGDAGLLASDLLPELPLALRAVKQGF